MKRIFAAALALLTAIVLGLVVTASPAASDVTQNVSVDAHVQSTAASTNFATSSTLVVNDASATRYAYVKVAIPNPPPGEPYFGTDLHLYMTATSGDAIGQAINVDLVSNSWTETGVTWNNKPAVLASNISSPATFQGNGWYVLPVGDAIDTGTTVSFRVRTTSDPFISIHSQENASGNGPLVVVDTTPASVQNPSATRGSTACGVLDVDYATGAGDNAASQFVTTLDGVQVDSESVATPSGTGGHNENLVEDSSGGSASVVVTGNGSTLLSFEVDTDCVTEPVQNPTATRASTVCGVVDVDYATGASDNTASDFVTTVDGSAVDSETVSAPSGTGGYGPNTLTEDSSGGSADVVVTGNGSTVLSFAVDTDCVEPEPTGVIVGMSAPANLWDGRLADVGPCGVEARRIFADLTSSGTDQSDLIADAIDATMTPVISYKVPSVATLNSNGYDSWLNNLNSYLDGLNVEVIVTFWHEPADNLTPTEFKDGSQQFLDHLTASNIKLGPIMNGWLLDTTSNTAVFASYTSASLINQWDYFGVDSYQAGTVDNPHATKYGGRAVPLLRAWLDGQGYTDKPIVLGEYNGFEAWAIDAGGDQVLLAANKVLAGLVWNSQSEGGKGLPLSGDRLAEYQEDKADSRALHSPAC